MLKRQVGEGALNGFELLRGTAVDAGLGEVEGGGVVSEGERCVAVDVAGELVGANDQR